MEYIHFGLRRTIEGQLNHYPEEVLKKHNTLELSLDIDGLPLFKSSKIALWPVLCAIHLHPTHVFPVTLTSGPSLNIPGLAEHTWVDRTRVQQYHDARLGFDLSIQVFCFRFNARSRERGVYRVILLTFTNWIDLFHSMNSYEELKNLITARGDTVAHNKAREVCWQKNSRLCTFV